MRGSNERLGNCRRIPSIACTNSRRSPVKTPPDHGHSRLASAGA
jgi:hypothetical protein